VSHFGMSAEYLFFHEADEAESSLIKKRFVIRRTAFAVFREDLLGNKVISR
jgi:hypothetical protein